VSWSTNPYYTSEFGSESIDSQFIIDSGCTSHMIKDRSLFDDYIPVNGRSCTNANQSVSEVVGTGSVRLRVTGSTGSERTILFTKCLNLPSYARNLISVSALENKG
jgi:hypothetical protein